ncbi:helix-turn-helix transcriptional regulator [Agrobacterium rubi]|nr:helix-turn-helix transcriptional regulator [Agrobacterium rubi]NTF24875.1 helix-turn-helix transcriptional regulator [Agrobacterium rubi]
MNTSTWFTLERLRDMVACGEDISGMLNAAMEQVADVLPYGDSAMLNEGALSATRSLALLEAMARERVDHGSSEFRAGRLSAIIDILGYAAAATASSADVERARSEPLMGIMRILADGPLEVEMIAERSELDAEALSEALEELRGIGMVADQRRGMQVFKILTPVGSLLVARPT